MTDSVATLLAESLSRNTSAIDMQTSTYLSIFQTAILVIAMGAILLGWSHGRSRG